MAKPVAIVTGAGGDIGRAIARGLLEDGYAVLAADVSKTGLDAALKAFNGGMAVKGAVCDVTDPASVADMARAAVELGAVRVLVNCAGAISSASLQSTGRAEWRADLELNLEGAFNCFKAVESALKANKGILVNIASVNGLGTFGHPGYSAAKAGLIQFTRMVAVEYGKFGMRANAVAPGTVETGAWRARAAANPNVMVEARRWYPLQRVARPEDVANAVRFLVSDKAGAITGITLPVDCGLLAGQAELAGTFSQSPDY